MPLQKKILLWVNRDNYYSIWILPRVMSEEAIRIGLELVEFAETYSEQVNEKA